MDSGSAVPRLPRSFDLVRYFSWTCLGVFVAVTTVMCFAFYRVSARYIRSDVEVRSVRIARDLVQIVFGESSNEPPRGSAEFRAMDRHLREVQHTLQIAKIKIYDADHSIVYSTDPSIRLGQVDAANAKLALAFAGEVSSKIEYGDWVWDLPNEERSGTGIVETYVPIPDPRTGRIDHVFELYQDVSETTAKLPALVGVIVGTSVLAMGLVYAVLLVVVRKAQAIIEEQTQEITRSKQKVEHYAVELEGRVAERTRQLRDTITHQQQSEKMIAMGTLAAGVAHELNTPLGSILGSAQLMMKHLASHGAAAGERPGKADCPTCTDDLGRIESQARRCKEIVRELMGFARKSDGTRTTVDLARLLHQCVDLVQMDARRNSIAVATVIDEEFPSLLLNGNEIQQVFVNIMQNGIAAMPDGGTLSVSLRNHGDRAVVLITDTGAGIAPENLNRVFEPFFTTKDPGSGTGLGLWISYRIIDDHGGQITVQSTPGRGTQFSVALPFADMDSAETRSPKGGGTPA